MKHIKKQDKITFAIIAVGLLAAGIILSSNAVSAASGPAPFQCPWTAVSGTNPSDGGDYGGDDVSGP